MLMRTKSFLALLLAIVLALPAFTPALAQDAQSIQGYNKSAGYQYVTFGTFPADADGTARPILWRVLRSKGGEAYALSEYILFGAPVHGDYDHYQGWENSDLYAYLNDQFLNWAFTPEEQAALLVRTEDNARVTLITSDEMKDASIGFSSNNARLAESTAWAKVLQDPPLWELPAMNNKGRWKPLYVYSKGKKYSPWWSRTRSTDYPHEQRRVMDEGKIGRISVGNCDLGVRPVITLDLSVLSILSGSGTMADPFVLSSLAVPQDEPAPTEAPADEPVVQNTDNVTVEPDATAEPEPEATASPEPAAAEPTPVSQGFTAAANPEWIHPLFPELTEQGFLPDGEEEFVYKDEASGLWLYASQTLRIEINRRFGTNKNKTDLYWFEAQIFTRDSSEIFGTYLFDEPNFTKYGDRYKTEVKKIAKQYQLVFAINGDNLQYRMERYREERQKNANASYPRGLAIRHGTVYFDDPRKANTTTYPPLDVMGIYPDGTFSLHKVATTTADEMLAKGVTDTFAFGPILVENGETSPRSTEFGSTPNPRTAFGMVEPGYYIAVVVEGRTKKSPEGESCVWLGKKMAELGCEIAFNLDGGATSNMVFMGECLNEPGNYQSSLDRAQNEVFGIGHSDAVK